ncbi:MAG: class I SAM-dependent methyltransferase [Candidatus Binataceae bacterium]
MSPENFDPRRFKDNQRRDWDAAAAGWKKWWPVFERSAQHVSDRLIELAGVGSGGRVLDIATGNGEPAVTAARRVGGSGRVIAIDQAPGMLAIATERAASMGLGNIEFRQSDAESLAIGERDFDAVTCRWGLMFMPDLTGTLKGLHQRLKPQGRLATAVWSTPDKVPMITIAAEAVRNLAGLPAAAPGGMDPLRLADTSILEGALKTAGFKDIRVERMIVNFEFDSADAFTNFRREVSAPFRTMLASKTPELQRQILDAIVSAAQAHAGADGRIHTANETILFSARRD